MQSKFFTFLDSLSDSALIESIKLGYVACFESYKAYHGSPKVFGDFQYHATNRPDATDQLGPGFYFTSNPEDASMYAGNEEGANVRPAVLNIKKPIILDQDENTNQSPLSQLQVIKILKQSPNINDVLEGFGDVRREGYQKVFNRATSAYVFDDLWYQMKTIMGDMFSWNVEMYSKVIGKVTGYDGIIKQVTDTTTHYVAWNPNQIKPLYSKV